jgi:hypothetical protein
MADLTIVDCIREGYELSAHCARCKPVRRLDRDQLAATHAPDTTVLTLWNRSLRCAVRSEAARSLVVAANTPSYRRALLFGPSPDKSAVPRGERASQEAHPFRNYLARRYRRAAKPRVQSSSAPLVIIRAAKPLAVARQLPVGVFM